MSSASLILNFLRILLLNRASCFCWWTGSIWRNGCLFHKNYSLPPKRDNVVGQIGYFLYRTCKSVVKSFLSGNFWSFCFDSFTPTSVFFLHACFFPLPFILLLLRSDLATYSVCLSLRLPCKCRCTIGVSIAVAVIISYVLYNLWSQPRSSASRRTGLWIPLLVVLVCWRDNTLIFRLSLQWRICQRLW